MHTTPATFQTWVEQNSSRIFALAYRMTGQTEDAEEVVQDTFLKAYQRFDQFRHEASESTWLYRIATNCALDLLRKRKRRGGEPLPLESVGPSLVEVPPEGPSQIANQHFRKDLMDALAKLTPFEKTAFVLRHFEGQSCQTIAETLDTNTNRSKQAIFRAVKKLRKALKPWVTS